MIHMYAIVDENIYILVDKIVYSHIRTAADQYT